MPWGRVTITFPPTGYIQNYKRNGVTHHVDCQAMVAAAVADSVARINATPPAGGLPVGGVNVNRLNIAQNLPNDPGVNYRAI
jgi:hypothetical protein